MKRKASELETYRSDTGQSFGFDDLDANKRRLRALSECDPDLIASDDRYRLFHCLTARQSCFYRHELKPDAITYYVPFALIELPLVGQAVAASSWASLMHGIGTASKDRVFFGELPALAHVIVSSPCLMRDGVRFWLDLQAHARLRGYRTGLVYGDGRVIEHEADTDLDRGRIDDYKLVQESTTVSSQLRFFYAKA